MGHRRPRRNAHAAKGTFPRHERVRTSFSSPHEMLRLQIFTSLGRRPSGRLQVQTLGGIHPAVTTQRGAGLEAPLVPHVGASRWPQPSGESAQECGKNPKILTNPQDLCFPQKGPLWSLGTWGHSGNTAGISCFLQPPP